jgi:hypothetical protein
MSALTQISITEHTEESVVVVEKNTQITIITISEGSTVKVVQQ